MESWEGLGVMSQGVGCLSKGKMGDGRPVPSSEMGASAILSVCA